MADHVVHAGVPVLSAQGQGGNHGKHGIMTRDIYQFICTY